jgi:hypothetical protein
MEFKRDCQNSTDTEWGVLNLITKAWEIIYIWMNFLPPTFTLKCKWSPSGRVRNFKAKGYKQLEGVDFFETVVTIFNWQTI